MVGLEEVQSNYGRLKFVIGGKWVDSQPAHGQPVVNPAKAETIAEVPFAMRAPRFGLIVPVHGMSDLRQEDLLSSPTSDVNCNSTYALIVV